MWGGPLREAIWATRGSQEEPRNRKDKTNDVAERPQSDDDLRKADSKSDKTVEQRPRNGRRVKADS